MLNKIVLREFAQEDLNGENWQRLRALAPKVLSAESEAQWRAELADSDVTMVKLGHIVNRADIESAPQLKYIGVFASAVSPIDLGAATSSGITVCNVAGYSTEAVAEFALGVTLDHFRELPRVRHQAQAKNYSAAGFKGREINGKTCGVIGLGRIGARVAQLMHALGAKVLYWSRTRKPEMERRAFHTVSWRLCSRRRISCRSISLSRIPRTASSTDHAFCKSNAAHSFWCFRPLICLTMRQCMSACGRANSQWRSTIRTS